MPRLPRVAVIAAVVAFLVACSVVLNAALGPLVLMPAALIPLAAGIGILRRRAWSAWGYAIVLISQLLILPAMLWRPGGMQISVETLQMVVGAAIFSPALAVLFYFAGKSLAATGSPRGHAAPWIVVALAMTVPLFFVQAFSVPTGSMENTLLVGDRILVQKFPAAEPRFGEVMALVYPVDRKQTFIKRVVGMPGDRIKVVHKVLYRNGSAATEPWAIYKLDYEDSYRDDFPSEPNTPVFPQAAEMLGKDVVNGEVVVPAGKYFVMGDNRDQSLDSRYWGFVSKGNFIGRPVLIYDSVEQPMDVAAKPQIFRNGPTRWNRLFRLL
jgi:signal peptidase I